MLAGLALAPVASARVAGPDPGADPQVAGWLADARAFWGRSPACAKGVTTVRAQWSADPGAWAATVPGACAIALDPDFYPRPATLDPGLWDAAMCTVVTHEWGHLLGFGHAADPRSIMAPVAPLNAVPGCAAWPAGAPIAPATRPGPPARAHHKRRAGRRLSRRARARARAHARARRSTSE
jgi:hypothetical protein